jgi:uncharacterized Zn-finger protein
VNLSEIELPRNSESEIHQYLAESLSIPVEEHEHGLTNNELSSPYDFQLFPDQLQPNTLAELSSTQYENPAPNSLPTARFTGPLSVLKSATTQTCTDTPSSSNTEITSNDTSQTSISTTPASVNGSPIQCSDCGLAFRKRHEFKYGSLFFSIGQDALLIYIYCSRHRKVHDRPYGCPMEGCQSSFAFNRHLQRHLSGKHRLLEPSSRLCCPFSDCNYSASRCKRGFSRKDTLRRHIRNYHFTNSDS